MHSVIKTKQSAGTVMANFESHLVWIFSCYVEDKSQQLGVDYRGITYYMNVGKRVLNMEMVRVGLILLCI